MRMIVTLNSNCISLQKWKNAEMNSELDSIEQECRTNQLNMKNFLCENDKVSTDSILSTTTTIITRQLQIIYDISKLTIIYMYLSYEKISHRTTTRSNNRIFAISQQHQIVSSLFNYLQCLLFDLDCACLVYLIWLDVIRSKVKIVS